METENTQIERKMPAKKENRYDFQKSDIEKEPMVRMEEIAKQISVTWKNASLRIADVKRLIPYLAAQAFVQTGESEDDILDYIDGYFKPALLEYVYNIRNSAKFNLIEN